MVNHRYILDTRNNIGHHSRTSGYKLEHEDSNGVNEPRVNSTEEEEFQNAQQTSSVTPRVHRRHFPDTDVHRASTHLSDVDVIVDSDIQGTIDFIGTRQCCPDGTLHIQPESSTVMICSTKRLA